MAILEHLIPNAEAHLNAWRTLVRDRSDTIIERLTRIGDLIETREGPNILRVEREIVVQFDAGAILVPGSDRIKVPQGWDWAVTMVSVESQAAAKWDLRVRDNGFGSLAVTGATVAGGTTFGQSVVTDFIVDGGADLVVTTPPVASATLVVKLWGTQTPSTDTQEVSHR